jgi:hypothetical protein
MKVWGYNPLERFAEYKVWKVWGWRFFRQRITAPFYRCVITHYPPLSSIANHILKISVRFNCG